jgi:hypothetical protein
MVADHKEMQKLIEEYDKQMTIFKFRFPERGLKEERLYSPHENKSLDQMEQELGLDGKLNRNMKKMRSQYSSPEKTPQTTDEKPTEKKPEEPVQKSIDESGSIILKK